MSLESQVKCPVNIEVINLLIAGTLGPPRPDEGIPTLHGGRPNPCRPTMSNSLAQLTEVETWKISHPCWRISPYREVPFPARADIRSGSRVQDTGHLKNLLQLTPYKYDEFWKMFLKLRKKEKRKDKHGHCTK